MEASATSSPAEDLSVQKTKAAIVDGCATEMPCSQNEPASLDNSAAIKQTVLTALVQDSSRSPGPLHEATPVETNLSSGPLLLTYGNSNVDASAEEPSKEIVKVSTDDEGKKRLASTELQKVMPCVGAFTVQCALCMKWRLIPTKEQYEQIRHSILQKPFFCSSTLSWRPDASCEQPSDVSQDESHLWAIDKPNIPVAPRGWERQLVIRGAGASKFADVYYVSPSGRKLRSMPEVERFLTERPDYRKAGLKTSQFSFLIPRPLDANYCRKRTPGPSTRAVNGSENQKKLTSGNKSKQASKLSVKRKAFESLSSKEGMESLSSKEGMEEAGSQKSSLGAGKGLAEDSSFESLISQQVVKGLLPPQEMTNSLSRGFSMLDSENPEAARALQPSQEHPTATNTAESTLPDSQIWEHGRQVSFSPSA